MNRSPDLAYDPIEPSASSVITELNRVLGQALDQVACEQRLDLAYEVMETVRFEHSHISWLDRLRNTSGQIEIRIPHTQLPVVQAKVSHLANPFLILSSSQYQYFVNSDYVTSVLELNVRAIVSINPEESNWLNNVWFHEISDRRALGTWYLNGNQSINGYCLRTGFDAIDIDSNGETFTLPMKAIIAGRIAEFGSAV